MSRVENTSKGPQVFVSRSHPDLLKRLFEQEVPEVYDGIVEIMSIAREAGDRAKVAVRSHDPNIDPVGTCVGPKGQRVQAIVNELKGENMDIVEWNEDPAVFIANALNPAQVEDVIFDTNNPKVCTVVVPDYQLSLAIGKRGQNARLAAKLTAHKIDIKAESDMAEFYENYDDGDFDESPAGLAEEQPNASEAAAESEATEANESTETTPVEAPAPADDETVTPDMTEDDIENVALDNTEQEEN